MRNHVNQVVGLKRTCATPKAHQTTRDLKGQASVLSSHFFAAAPWPGQSATSPTGCSHLSISTQVMTRWHSRLVACLLHQHMEYRIGKCTPLSVVQNRAKNYAMVWPGAFNRCSSRSSCCSRRTVSPQEVTRKFAVVFCFTHLALPWAHAPLLVRKRPDRTRGLERASMETFAQTPQHDIEDNTNIRCFVISQHRGRNKQNTNMAMA